MAVWEIPTLPGCTKLLHSISASTTTVHRLHHNSATVKILRPKNPITLFIINNLKCWHSTGFICATFRRSRKSRYTDKQIID